MDDELFTIKFVYQIISRDIRIFLDGENIKVVLLNSKEILTEED